MKVSHISRVDLVEIALILDYYTTLMMPILLVFFALSPDRMEIISKLGMQIIITK